jgi:GTPase Era involved in 16S rRNA processing
VFNESQQRYLINRLSSIESLLTEAAQQLQPGDSRLFRKIQPDATSMQRKTLHDYVVQIRFALRRFVLAQQLEDSQTYISGLWSFQTSLTFASIAAEELRPKYWSGYGDVHPEGAAATERLSAELTTLLRRVEVYLLRGEGGDLAARIASLDATTREFDLLQQLERVVSSHGLTELRGPLALLADRAAQPRFEVAVVGRVSSGKSSLLNWWLGEPVLPVGVTPVTAVPTRIVHGAPAIVRVTSASGPAVSIPLEQLADYVTEQGNPQNSRRLIEIVVQVPAQRLMGGVCLVDTPGLGSLASAGALQTLEYLPNCDLGILLIEAGAPVTQEDVNVARALIDAGSDVLLVLSKADRLPDAELRQMLIYVNDQFQVQLGVPIAARAISTVPTAATLAADWFDQELAPRLAKHRERAGAILRRKINALRESVIAVMRARLRETPRVAASSKSHPGRPSTHDDIAQAHSDFASARSQLVDLRLRLVELVGSLVDAAAAELSECWLEAVPDQALVRERVRGAVGRSAEQAGRAVVGMLSELRNRLREILQRCDGVQELSPPRGLPVFDAGTLADPADYQSPRFAPRLSKVLVVLARNRVHAGMQSSISKQLAAYGAALCHWGRLYLSELETQFDAAAAAFEVSERLADGEQLSEDSREAARRDLELLERWSEQAARAEARAVPVP